jgi:hypothetical protein
MPLTRTKVPRDTSRQCSHQLLRHKEGTGDTQNGVFTWTLSESHSIPLGAQLSTGVVTTKAHANMSNPPSWNLKLLAC